MRLKRPIYWLYLREENLEGILKKGEGEEWAEHLMFTIYNTENRGNYFPFSRAYSSIFFMGSVWFSIHAEISPIDGAFSQTCRV